MSLVDIPVTAPDGNVNGQGIGPYSDNSFQTYISDSWKTEDYTIVAQHGFSFI